MDRDLVHPEQSYNARIYVNALATPRGARYETNDAGRRRISIFGGFYPLVVLDPDAKTFWKPKTSGRVAVSHSSSGSPAEPQVGGEQAKRKYPGRETINGRKAYHWEITEPLPNATNLVWQYWEDIRLHMALKLHQPGVRFYELTNIREGKQPADLFKLPAGYREVAAPQSE